MLIIGDGFSSGRKGAVAAAFGNNILRHLIKRLEALPLSIIIVRQDEYRSSQLCPHPGCLIPEGAEFAGTRSRCVSIL